MGQPSIAAPLRGVVWKSALALLLGVSYCAAQDDPPDPSAAAGTSQPSPAGEANDVLDMDLDQLSQADVLVPTMDTVVSTVSRQESTVGRSPAAVFVITPDMIKRSGANNIPDLLRMVPGMEVAQIDANQWAISCRGFNGLYADKLLVQIDGRVLYSQVFSGVYWDAQDTPLEDIERIEVVRGPGATVWGSNAVNGVINIITKNANETQGLLVDAGTGTQYREFGTVRYGNRIGEDFAWRVYGKQFDRDLGNYPGLDGGFNQWEQARGGFRTDWEASDWDAITIQGDFYDGTSGNALRDSFPTAPYARIVQGDTVITGQNFLGRWTRSLDDDSDWSLQSYYDRNTRDGLLGNLEQQTFDVDAQYHVLLDETHNMVWGTGYRRVDTNTRGIFSSSLVPADRTTELFSYFVQDEITLETDRWYLIAGSKFEHNSFTGFEFQPTIRLLHLPSERESVWAAVSRAVRIPSLANEDLVYRSAPDPAAPAFVQLLGNRFLAAEELLAWECGYRAQPSDDFSWDLALFYNDYHNLLGVESAGAPFFDPSLGALIIPTTWQNSLAGDTYGAELASTLQLNDRWEITGAYTLLYMDIHAPEGNLIQGSSPHNQVYLRSSWNPRSDWKVDLIGRYVDNLAALNVPSYLTGDVRLAWTPRKNLEWAVVGRNLIDSPHLEFADPLGGTIGSEVEPEVFTTLTWTY